LFIVVALSLLVLPEVSCGYYYFGKNKVQYLDLDWQVIHTPSVDIYFYPQEKWLALEAAEMLETIIPALSVHLNHTLTSKIPLIIYSSHQPFQETNVIPYILPESVAGVTEFFKGRVLMPFDGSLSRFRATLTHEVVHYFTLNKIKFVMRSRDKFYYPIPPLWYMEGIAEYYSSRWDSEADMVLGDAVLNGYFAPLEDIHHSYRSYLVYKEGQSLVGYIAETYGGDKIPAMLDNIWVDESFNKVMEFTLGVDVGTLSRGWEGKLREEYLPLVVEYDEPTTSALPLAKSESIDVSAEAFTLGGRNYLVFVSNRSGYTNIYMGRLEVSEHGARCIYLSDVECIVKGQRTPEFESLHIFRSSLAVSPSGELAFVSKSGANDVLNIMDLNSREVVATYRFEQLIGIFSPAFFPRGDRLVFAGQDLSGQVDIFMLDRANGELTALTDDRYADRDPTVLPDGENVLFSSDRSADEGEDESSLYLLKLTEESGLGEVERLTYEHCRDIHPRPLEGGKVLFASDRSGRFNIYTLDLSTGELWQNTNLTTGAFEPTLTTDGEELIFDCYSEGNISILTMPYRSAFIGSVEVILEEGDGQEEAEEDTADDYRHEKYSADYSLDIIQAEVAYSPDFGGGAGAIFSFTDMLNDNMITLSFSNSAETVGDFFSRMNIGVNYYNLAHRLNFGLGGFHYLDDYYDWNLGYLYSERRYGATALLSYPLSRFYRIESGVNLYGFRRSFFDEPLKGGVAISHYVSFVKDTSLWNSVGPIDGSRYNLTVSQTGDLTRQEFQYYLFSCDLRRYVRISQQSCYALRLIFRASGGPDVLPLAMGGSLSMRGYKYRDFMGTKLFIFNQELRFPILKEMVIDTPIGKANLGSFHGAFFFDIGEAWDEKLGGVRGDFGFSLRWGLFNVFVFRLDVAKKTDFHSISKDTPVRFFVGWNY